MTIPLELAFAREFRDLAWDKYGRAIEAGEKHTQLNLLALEAEEWDRICQNLYNKWQAIGGTSDIESLFADPQPPTEAEKQATEAQTIDDWLRSDSGAALYGEGMLTRTVEKPAATWAEFAAQRDRNFNRHYYGNSEGKPTWMR